MIDMITNYIIQYTPLGISIILAIINIKKVGKGLKLLDVYTPLSSLKVELKAQFRAFMDEIKHNKKEIAELREFAKEQSEKIVELRAIQAQAVEENKKIILDQKEMIKALVSENVQLRAELRRKNDDGEGL